MPKLNAFINVSLDGYYADAAGDMRWAHHDDPEFQAFVEGNASGGGRLVFGRVTYEMMAGYWPTPLAAENNPLVAERMNALPKVVFSRTLARADWSNTTLFQGDLVAEMRKLKAEPGPDMATLGSGRLVAQLAAAGLIDELQLVMNPLLLGGGKKLFADVEHRIQLELTQTRSFDNGCVLMCYRPAG